MIALFIITHVPSLLKFSSFLSLKVKMSPLVSGKSSFRSKKLEEFQEAEDRNGR